MRFITNIRSKRVLSVGVGLMLTAVAGCGPKPAAEAPQSQAQADYVPQTKEPTAGKPSQGIVSMADAYIEEALSRPIEKLYIEAKASQSNEARFRLGLALLAGRSFAVIKDAEFTKTPAMAEPRYWLERAKPKSTATDASAQALATAGGKDYTPLTTYVFETGVACVADLKLSLKTPTPIAIDQAKDSCWGEPAYERYKAELAKNP
jgi:hypothetical protein